MGTHTAVDMEGAKKEVKTKSHLERYSTFVAKTAARDKVLKTIGYVCKLLVAMDKSYEPRFKNLSTRCSEARRMFWLGRSVAEFKTLQDLLAKNDGSLVWLLQTVSRFGFVVRYLFENFIILSKAGLFKPSNLPEVVRICSKFWFVAVFGTFAANLVKLIKKHSQLSALRNAVKTSASHETRAKEVQLRAERDALVYTLVSTVGDCTNACTGSNAIQTVLGITPTPKFISCAGTVGGFMQVYQAYS